MNQANPKGAGKSSFELINTDILKHMLPVRQGSVILDLACGKGLYSLFLSKLAGPSGLVYTVSNSKFSGTLKKMETIDSISDNPMMDEKIYL